METCNQITSGRIKPKSRGAGHRSHPAGWPRLAAPPSSPPGWVQGQPGEKIQAQDRNQCPGPRWGGKEVRPSPQPAHWDQTPPTGEKWEEAVGTDTGCSPGEWAGREVTGRGAVSRAAERPPRPESAPGPASSAPARLLAGVSPRPGWAPAPAAPAPGRAPGERRQASGTRPP